MKVKGGIWTIDNYAGTVYLCLSEGSKQNPFTSLFYEAKYGYRKKFYRGDWSTRSISKTHRQLVEKGLTTW